MGGFVTTPPALPGLLQPKPTEWRQLDAENSEELVLFPLSIKNDIPNLYLLLTKCFCSKYSFAALQLAL